MMAASQATLKRKLIGQLKQSMHGKILSKISFFSPKQLHHLFIASRNSMTIANLLLRTNRWESPAPWDPGYKTYIATNPLEKVTEIRIPRCSTFLLSSSVIFETEIISLSTVAN